MDQAASGKQYRISISLIQIGQFFPDVNAAGRQGLADRIAYQSNFRSDRNISLFHIVAVSKAITREPVSKEMHA